MTASRNKNMEAALRELCSALSSDANVEQYTREVAQRLLSELAAAEPVDMNGDGEHDA